jgi:hypothetical protein
MTKVLTVLKWTGLFTLAAVLGALGLGLVAMEMMNNYEEEGEA